MSESAKSGLAEAVAAQKKRPVTSGMETSELPVHGSNRTSARIQTARSTPRLPKCRRLQGVLEVNRRDEMRGGWPKCHPPFLNRVGCLSHLAELCHRRGPTHTSASHLGLLSPRGNRCVLGQLFRAVLLASTIFHVSTYLPPDVSVL